MRPVIRYSQMQRRRAGGGGEGGGGRHSNIMLRYNNFYKDFDYFRFCEQV